MTLKSLLKLVTVGLVLPVSLSACYSSLVPFDATATPFVSVPLDAGGVDDSRGRFREIYCAVLEARRDEVPDYEPCATALVTVGSEPTGAGEPVALAEARNPIYAGFVPGVGYSCFRDWLEPDESVARHLRRFGYDGEVIDVHALSSSASNAQQIRDWVVQFAARGRGGDLVLVGYSKGAADILQALVHYPEVAGRVAAVISMAGAIGGSPLANEASQRQLELLTHWPDSDCDGSDGGGIESLRPQVRQAWLAENELPPQVRYYSLVTFPEPDRISRVLKSSYRDLGRIDGRNDGQVLYHDQIVPGSSLIAFANADHWAIAVPVARSRPRLGRVFVNHNNYPREALLEAVLRFVEEDLTRSGTQ